MKIIFLNLTASRIWPDIETEKGIGASDAFIIHVTKALAKKDHEVKLYANTPFNGMNDGVRWENDVEPDLLEECDLLVVNRGVVNIHNFKYKKMIYWAHDNTDAPIMKGIELFLPKPDVIVAVSEWHKNRILKLAREKKVSLDPEKIIVVGNGLALPAEKPKKKEFSACFASVPFKGLHVLAKIWPMIRKVVPGLKLHVCSGMDLHNMPGHDLYYSQVYHDLKKDKSVILHGVIPNHEVREVMKKCSLMIYPNTFAETFCVAAYESISVGAPVITSDLAALPETILNCGILIKGDPTAPGDGTKPLYFAEMLKVLKDILVDNPSKLLDLRKNCYKRKMRTWSDVADDLERIAERIP